MELEIASATAAAAKAARTSLSELARGSGVDEPRMAKVAQAAIFEEALLSALHSRLNELRSVAK